MKFSRTKKVMFTNNKGGVGKTTLAYNLATKFAEKGYKTCMIDFDPQCNLSRIALGEYFDENLLSGNVKNIYDVLRGVIVGGSDIDLKIEFQKLANPNLFILPGSLKLSEYENSLISAYGEAAQGYERGYFVTSALNRFLNSKGINEEIDIFIIDTSPSLNLINRIAFLSSDYFISPLMPDAFSVQGIENLGNTFEDWKENWKKTGKAIARDKKVSLDMVMDGDSLFLGYIVNSYNQYGKKPISKNEVWIERIPEYVKKYLSEKHGRNGLVEKSWTTPLSFIKDCGQLAPLSQEKNKAIFNLDPVIDHFDVRGTQESLEIAKKEFEILSENILGLIAKY